MNSLHFARHPNIKNSEQIVRSGCHGLPPMDARLESWMTNVLLERGSEVRLNRLVEQFGSPLNLLNTAPFRRNISDLQSVAADHDLPFRVFFARKANKCLSFVEAALQIEAGIDVASEQELQQSLDRGAAGDDVICTAAIKSRRLVELCLRHDVTLVVDNDDEWKRIAESACRLDSSASIAIRISGFTHDGEKLHSRFGFDIDDVLSWVTTRWRETEAAVRIDGLHFHLDGYSAAQRISAIRQSLDIADELQSRGHHLRFVDIGGGFPMSYLSSHEQWDAFWTAHRNALLGRRPAVTYRNHGLGKVVVDGRIHGSSNVYPYYQSLVQADWLTSVLNAVDSSGATIADAIRRRQLQLRCEPGRSVLDGCGLTVARVEFTKRHRNGDWLIGLSMNRTQCRTSSDDFLVDPVVVPAVSENPDHSTMDGYLVGAYCTESELLSLRKLRFPRGITAGDLVVFPNTAGYLMHFLESRSHQFPLAQNVFVDRTTERGTGSPHVDGLDEVQFCASHS